MLEKHLLCPPRVRTTPQQFSWVDQNLVRANYVGECTHKELALYLFLVTVSDSQGISYYSDHKISELLSLNQSELSQAREGLIKADLLAYQKPFYQVLSLS